VGEYLVSLYHEAGIPKDCVRLLIGGPAEGKALAAHPDVGGILFTGSAHSGIAINRQFAAQPGKILALEMGGNNPIVVWDTPQLSDAAALVIQSAFLSAGQRCTAASRLIVKESLADALLAEVKKIADRLIVDHPHADPAPFMGPVIDNETADGLTESFLYLMSNGGKPIRHMVRPVKGRPFLSPAIIDVTAMAERPDVELFGPLLQVIRVPDFAAAIAEANNTRYGLSASLVGGSPEQYNQFWSSVRAGVVNWNRPTNGASSSAPFGGVGLSGNHRPSAYYAADYCAYPVVSAEIEAPRASIGVGLKDIDISAMGD
jgi:succinylglutamic semialdehyde dehydrogenase